MANTFKKKPVEKNKDKKNLFSFMDGLIKTKDIFDEGVPVKMLPKIIFFASILIFYIGNTHYAERTVRKIEKLKVRVDDLRADYTTLKAEVMYSSKQSEVSRRVAAMGLEESLQAPYKIVVKQNEY
jgi:hypothetical protein